jgi:hypothetical protein
VRQNGGGSVGLPMGVLIHFVREGETALQLLSAVRVGGKYSRNPSSSTLPRKRSTSRTSSVDVRMPPCSFPCSYVGGTATLKTFCVKPRRFVSGNIGRRPAAGGNGDRRCSYGACRGGTWDRLFGHRLGGWAQGHGFVGGICVCLLVLGVKAGIWVRTGWGAVYLRSEFRTPTKLHAPFRGRAKRGLGRDAE